MTDDELVNRIYKLVCLRATIHTELLKLTGAKTVPDAIRLALEVKQTGSLRALIDERDKDESIRAFSGGLPTLGKKHR